MSPALSGAAFPGCGFAAAEEGANRFGRNDGVRRRERDAGDAPGVVGDRRHEADQRALSIEHRSAAGALVHRRDDGGPRLAARKRGRACRETLAGETEDDKVLRRLAEARRFALRGEISGDQRKPRRGVGALDPYGLAGHGRVRAVVRLERGQRFAGRDDERGRGRLGNGRGLTCARRGGSCGATDSLAAGAAAASGNGSNELATAIAIRLS